jgi:hypothetical protein
MKKEENTELSIQDIINWCDEQSAQGHEVSLKWEGGGDSGWVYLEVDGEQTSSEEAEWLIDKMYDTLDYGSWAGEYSVNGEASYNSDTKEFEGTDYFSTEDDLTFSPKKSFTLRVPKNCNFDTIVLNCEGESYDFEYEIYLRNGFVTSELTTVMDSQIELLNKWSEEVLEELTGCENNDITAGYETYELARNEFELDGNDYVYNMTTFTYRIYDTSETGICINLLELLENEN